MDSPSQPMNKIVQQLIDNSKDYVDCYDGGSAMYGSPPTVIPEDLVVLAVRECVKVCRENNAFVAANLIKKHFGIS